MVKEEKKLSTEKVVLSENARKEAGKLEEKIDYLEKQEREYRQRADKEKYNSPLYKTYRKEANSLERRKYGLKDKLAEIKTFGYSTTELSWIKKAINRGVATTLSREKDISGATVKAVLPVGVKYLLVEYRKGSDFSEMLGVQVEWLEKLNSLV